MTHEEKQSIFEYLYSEIPLRKERDTRQSIIDACRITDNILENWLSGRTRIPDMAIPYLEKIFDCNFENILAEEEALLCGV